MGFIVLFFFQEKYEISPQERCQSKNFFARMTFLPLVFTSEALQPHTVSCHRRSQGVLLSVSLNSHLSTGIQRLEIIEWMKFFPFLQWCLHEKD